MPGDCADRPGLYVRWSEGMARRYSKSTSQEVKNEMHRYKRGTAKSGPGGRGGRVKNWKQAIAIALSKARKKGKKAPKRRADSSRPSASGRPAA